MFFMKRIVCLFLITFCNLCLGEGELVVASDRHDFKDADRTSHGQYRRLVSPEHPHHSWDISNEDWEHVKEGSHIALVIHGYNTDYEKAIEYFKDVRERSGSLYDTMVFYLWPSGDEFWEYYEAEDRVDGKALPKRLAELVSELREKSDRVDVIAHSMGCRLILESLKYEPINTFGNVFLLAPAVDKDSLTHKILQVMEELFVFYSHNDDVLNWVYPIAEWHQALGAEGDDKKQANLHFIDSSSHIKHHTDYATSGYIFSIIAKALSPTI